MNIAENPMNIGPITDSGKGTMVVIRFVNMNRNMTTRSAMRPVKSVTYHLRVIQFQH